MDAFGDRMMTYSQLKMLFWISFLVAPTLSVAESGDAQIAGKGARQSFAKSGSELQAEAPSRSPSGNAVSVPAAQKSSDDDC